MNTYVISAEGRYRIMDFLKGYQPFMRSESEQIALLKKKLESAVIVPELKLSRSIVTMYSTVKIAALEERETYTYTLVYPQYANASRRQLSLLSPLGTALLGCNEGDFFDCAISGETFRYAVKEVLYQPEWDERSRS